MNTPSADLENLVVREFCLDDYEGLIALWEAARLPYRPQGRDAREAFARQIREPTAIYLVAELEGTLVGSVLGTHDGRKGWINRLAVHPERRRRGIARRLVGEIERRLRAGGIEIVAALVEDWNATSLRVFERLGYVCHHDIHYMSKRANPDI